MYLLGLATSPTIHNSLNCKVDRFQCEKTFLSFPQTPPTIYKSLKVRWHVSEAIVRSIPPTFSASYKLLNITATKECTNVPLLFCRRQPMASPNLILRRQPMASLFYFFWERTIVYTGKSPKLLASSKLHQDASTTDPVLGQLLPTPPFLLRRRHWSASFTRSDW